MEHFQPQQAVTNSVAKRASSSEPNRWRNAGVDPELLQAIMPLVASVVSLKPLNNSSDEQFDPPTILASERTSEV